MRSSHNGLPTMLVIVTDVNIEKAFAEIKDSFGRNRTVRIDIRRGAGRMPVVGETWLLDRTLGEWTFAALYSVEDYLPLSGTTDGSLLEWDETSERWVQSSYIAGVGDTLQWDGSRWVPGSATQPVGVQLQHTPDDWVWASTAWEFPYFTAGDDSYDPYGLVSTLSEGAVTIPIYGTYVATFSVRMASADTGRILVRISKDATTPNTGVTVGQVVEDEMTAGVTYGLQSVAIEHFDEGDVLHGEAFSTSGNTVINAEFKVYKVG